jgi:hypothetical protein
MQEVEQRRSSCREHEVFNALNKTIVFLRVLRVFVVKNVFSLIWIIFSQSRTHRVPFATISLAFTVNASSLRLGVGMEIKGTI